MTLVVLLLALVLAVPVFLVAVAFKSKFLLTVAAIIAAIIGAATGSPIYTPGDWIGVAIAFFFGLAFINGKQRSQSSHSHQAGNEAKRKSRVQLNSLPILSFTSRSP